MVTFSCLMNFCKQCYDRGIFYFISSVHSLEEGGLDQCTYLSQDEAWFQLLQLVTMSFKILS